MGRGIIESGLFRTERVDLEERTTDPSETSEGEMWIRTDVAPDTDQIATLRMDTGSGERDIPIYDAAASTTNVAKAWRVRVGGATGFVPITDTSPAYDDLKVQHNGSAFGAHDALEASAIPDSVVSLYDARELAGYSDGDDVGTFSAEVGTDLPGTAAYRASGINLQASVDYDGADDGHDADVGTLTQPYTIFAVVDADAVNDGNAHVVTGSWGEGNKSTPDSNLSYGDGWLWFAGGSIIRGSTDTSVSILTVRADGSNSVLREDGAETASGDMGSNDLRQISVGYYARTGGRYWIGDIGYVEVHDGLPANGLQTREQDIIDDWGLSV